MTKTTTLRGRWFRPERPQERIPGTMTISSDNVVTLDLFGTLVVEPDRWDAPVLFGEVDDVREFDNHTTGRVTLTRAYVMSQNTNMFHHDDEPKDGVLSERWGCADAVLGGWQPTAELARFSRFSLQANRLREWASVRPRIPSSAFRSTDEELDADQHFKPWPHVRRWRLDGLGELSLGWDGRASSTLTSATLDVMPVMSIDFDQPRTREDAWRLFVTPVLQWLALVTQGRVAIERLGLSAPADGDNLPYDGDFPEARYPDLQTFRWVPSVWSTPQSPEQRSMPHQHLVSAREATDRDGVLARWVEHATENRFALLQLFAERFGAQLDLEDAFARTVRAVEVWHRTNRGGNTMPPEEFKALLKALEETAGEHRQFVTERLQHGNALTLRSRIEQQLAISTSAVQILAGQYQNFAGRVVRTRNDLTHKSHHGGHFTNEQLIYARKILEYLLWDALLRQLGYTEQETDSKLRQSADWHWVADGVHATRDSVVPRP